MSVTICECGLAKCYHEGSHDLATRSQNGKPPICSGYKTRAANWWKVDKLAAARAEEGK